MSYTYNSNFNTFNFFYKFLAEEYQGIREQLDESSREGFEVMYINSGSGLKRFIEKQKKTKNVEIPQEVMDIAWRRIEGMEHTLLELVENQVPAEMVA